MEVFVEPSSTCLRTRKKKLLCSTHSALSLLSHLNNSLLLTPQKAEVRPQKTAFSWTWSSSIVTFESPVFEYSSDLTKKNSHCVCYHIEKYYYQDGVHESAQSRNSKFRVDISKITPTITNHFCLSWRINVSFYRSQWSKTYNTCQYYGKFLVLVKCDLDFFLTLMNRY